MEQRVMTEEQRPGTVSSTNRVDPCRLEIREKSCKQDQPLKRLQFPFRSVYIVCSRARYFPLNFYRVSRESAAPSNTMSMDAFKIIMLDAFKIIRINDFVSRRRNINILIIDILCVCFM